MYKQGNLYKVNPDVKPVNSFMRSALRYDKTFILLEEVIYPTDHYTWRLTSDFPEEEKKAGYITRKETINFIPFFDIKNLHQDMEGGNI